MAVLGSSGGGVPDWEYLLLSQDTQLVDGDAKAVEIPDAVSADTHLYLPPTQAGYSLSGEVMMIAAGTTTEDVSVNIDANNNPVAFTGDFVFEAVTDKVQHCPGMRGIQVGGGPTWEAFSSAIATLYVYMSGGLTYYTLDSSTMGRTTVAETGNGLLKIEAIGTTLNIYTSGTLIATGASARQLNAPLYMKMFGGQNGIQLFTTNTSIEAIRAEDGAASAGPKLLLPAATTGSTSSVNVRDFTSDKPLGPTHSLKVELSNGSIYGNPYYNITTPKGSFAFISPLGTEDWVADNNSTWGDTTIARSLRDKLKAPMGAPTTGGMAVLGSGGGGGTPDWEYLSLDQDTQLVDGEAKAVEVVDSSKKLLLPSTTTGSTSSVNIRDLAGDASSSSPIRVQASNANIFGGVVYNITTPKGSFNFISPIGTKDWVADNNSTWGDTTGARETPLRDKLMESSTGTTDLAKKDA